MCNSTEDQIWTDCMSHQHAKGCTSGALHMHLHQTLKLTLSTILVCNVYVFQDGVEIDLADKNGKTPLMLAVGRKHDAIVSYLKKEAQFRTSVLPRIDFWLGQFTVAQHVYYCSGPASYPG